MPFAQRLLILLSASCVLLAHQVHAAVSVTDDAGHTITLNRPAQRIVSLAPHTTELLYAAGAGDAVVGVSEYSNYPPQAAKIVSIGGSASLDIERIISLKPDLIVGWNSGNQAAQLDALRRLGFPVFASEPRDFETIASNLERISLLTGTGPVGMDAARAFRARLAQLTVRHRGETKVRVFYQIWRSPLMTLNDSHLVSQALHLCGGENVFGKLSHLVPTVNVEAVVKENPEVIISGSSKENDVFAQWRVLPGITAVARGNLFTISSDLMSRSGPRVLDGVELLCKHLDVARSRRK
jgi:iron complex transport system substrate-binding protein